MDWLLPSLVSAAVSVAVLVTAYLYGRRWYIAQQRHTQESRVLLDIANLLNSTLNLNKVLKRVTQRAAQACGAHRCTILMLAEDEEMLIPSMSQFSNGHVDREMWHLFQDASYPVPVSRVPEAQEIIRERRPLFIPDVSASSLPRHWIEPFGVKSVLVTPLISKERVIGLMGLDHAEEGREFTAEQADLAMAIAAQAALAIESARLFEETRKHVARLERTTRDLELVHQVSQVVSSSLDLTRILEATAEQMVAAFEADHSGILLFDQTQTHGQVVAEYPPTGATVEQFPVQGYPAAERIIADREPLMIEDAWSDPLMTTVREAMHRLDIRSMLIAPLIVKGEVVGSIGLDAVGRQRRFDAEEVALAQTIANQVAIAIENARLFEETNRRLTETRLLQEVMQAAASTLDFDEVLTRTVETLRRTLDIDHLGFALPDDSGTAMIRHPSMIGFTSHSEGLLRLPLDGSIVGRVYQTGEPLLAPDVRQVPDYFEVVSETCSELAVPVRVGDQVVGVLNMESPVLAAFDQDDLRLFTAIAAQLGVVLENTRLYRTLQERTEELSRAYGELKELDRLRTELVQNVGHELRTPLTLVQGYVELLLAGDLGHIPDNQQAALQIIHERTDTLTHLIHNLTMLQTVPREALVLASVSVIAVVQHALARFRRFAEEVGVVFREELPSQLPPVLGDQEQLDLVFGHLVDNAIKFSPDGGTVTLRAWTGEAWVYVSVADEGIGIAPDHLDYIFERFYQVDGTARRRFGGMGVGLALVWEIVEAHGGTVSVESEPGKGSTFIVALPRAT